MTTKLGILLGRFWQPAQLLQGLVEPTLTHPMVRPGHLKGRARSGLLRGSQSSEQCTVYSVQESEQYAVYSEQG